MGHFTSLSLIIAWLLRKNNQLHQLLTVWKVIIGVITLQFILGVATLSKMNILIASWHQMNALLLIAMLSCGSFSNKSKQNRLKLNSSKIKNLKKLR